MVVQEGRVVGEGVATGGTRPVLTGLLRLDGDLVKSVGSHFGIGDARAQGPRGPGRAWAQQSRMNLMYTAASRPNDPARGREGGSGRDSGI